MTDFCSPRGPRSTSFRGFLGICGFALSAMYHDVFSDCLSSPERCCIDCRRASSGWLIRKAACLLANALLSYTTPVTATPSSGDASVMLIFCARAFLAHFLISDIRLSTDGCHPECGTLS
ncbi:hypothetical protein BO83DRAFT_89369 [Aspergillus eucalypticola CBS 122712]|uniref:Uncharacterized protein n=1 Tax=Aspergillus eucalypticola (strain CBS 122712 / IBT 29274) TaxID=1448314 RepID=A0A317V1T1_ASPEC|nr:uncharacterized protein BO83DRAFT_89369 [Aspergillus eucalypticola CBS 122712]PWY68274.1 hypothetical protein BO83DRAFT_89369 [Aspergillus eucalypticola CBS 122712]